ncbi:MAG: hypothetical protein P8Y13_10230, partial [Deinococcales bacterium]
ELAGKKGKCPACQKIVVAPAIEHRPEKPEASRKEDVQDAEIFGGESEELLAKLEERPRGPSTGRFKIALKEIIDKVPRKAGARNRKLVTTPKLPPPPRRAQKRSGCSSALAVTKLPSARTTSALRRLSRVRPHPRDR